MSPWPGMFCFKDADAEKLADYVAGMQGFAASAVLSCGPAASP